jgi:very-short-patch-repair endonuclease
MHKLEYIANSIAQNQHGIITIQNLANTSAGKQKIIRLLNNGNFQKIYPGVYHCKLFNFTQKSEIAAALLTKRNALVSHESALFLFGLKKIADTKNIELISKAKSENRIGNITLHTTRFFKGIRPQIVENIKCVNTEHAILTCAPRFTYEQIHEQITDALIKRITTIGKLINELNFLTQIPMRKLLEKLLNEIEHEYSGIESHLEKRLISVCKDYSLPIPVRQYRVKYSGISIRIDFAYPKLKKFIEVDGRAFHTEFKTFHHDRFRETILRDNGWDGRRITSQTHAEEIARIIIFLLNN